MKKRVYIIVFVLICAFLSTTIVAYAAKGKKSEKKGYNLQKIEKLKGTDFKYKEKTKNKNKEKEYVNVYTDSEKNDFFYDSEGKLVGFKMKKSEKSTKTFNASKKEINCELIVEDYVKDVIDIENYTLVENVFNETMQLYYLTYYRYINGYKTSDFVMVSLDIDGNIIAYAAPNVGRFENIKIASIDELAMKKQLEGQLNSKYGDTYSKYVIEDSIIDFNDGNIIYIIYVLVEFGDETQVVDSCEIML